MTDPQVLLRLAYMVIGAPSREHGRSTTLTKPPPFEWGDEDITDTAASIDAHLHEGGDHAPNTQ